MGPSEKTSLAVIFGGRSGEHHVSLESAASVLEAIDKDKFSVIEIGITPNGRWFTGDGVWQAFKGGKYDGLTSTTILPDPSRTGLLQVETSRVDPTLTLLAGIDVVFPVLHGTYGEDGTLQGLFEMASIAYVGAGVTASALGMDKGIFKDVMRANGIPVLPAEIILRSELKTGPEDVVDRLEAFGPYPLFTKPANLGSSVGITKCRGRSDLLEGLMEAARFDRRILVELGIEAREIEVSVLGNDQPEASVPGEVIPDGDFYSYELKYHSEASELIIPAPISDEQTESVRSLAIKAYKAIDGAGLARVDFLLDTRDNKIYLNELNTMPGFTQISMYPKLWEASGLPYRELINRLVELALERHAQKKRTEFFFERESSI